MEKRIRRRTDRPRSATGLDLPVEREMKKRRRCCFENCNQITAVPKPEWGPYQFALCEHHMLMAHDDLARLGGVQNLPLRRARDEARRARERAEQDATAE